MLSTRIAQAIFKPRTMFPKYTINMADFKGHQSKALARMKDLSPRIDLVLELRDARVPISSKNDLLQRVVRDKEKLVLYTKRDQSNITADLMTQYNKMLHEDSRFINCRKVSDVSSLIRTLKTKYEKMYPKPPLGLRLMVLGMPNVGKSTLVNALRSIGLKRKKGHLMRKKRGSVAQVGSHAGVTRNTSEIIRICEDPDIYLYDTPGVLLPKVDEEWKMFSLSVAGIVSDVNQPDPVIMADYILFVMNLTDPSGKGYLQFLDHPTNDIYELLASMALKNKNYRRWRGDDMRRPNYSGEAIQFVQSARSGKLGRLCFDIAAFNALKERKFGSDEITAAPNWNSSML